MQQNNDYNQHLIGLIVLAVVFGIGFSVGLSTCKLFF